MWPFGMACPTEPRGKPLLAGLRLPGRAHGLAVWQGLWEWASGGVSAAHPGANSSSRLLCVAVGQLDRPPDLTDDGYDLGSCVGPVSQVGRDERITLDSWVTGGRGLLQLEFQKGPMGAMPGGSPAWRVSSPSISAPELFLICLGSGEWAASHAQAHVSICLLSPGRRNLWLNIGGKEATAPSTFHVSVPLPVVSGESQGRTAVPTGTGMRARLLAFMCPCLWDWGV